MAKENKTRLGNARPELLTACNQAEKSFERAGFTTAQAKLAVTLILQGKVKNVSIEY